MMPGLLKQILKTEVLKSRIIHSFYYSIISRFTVCLFGAKDCVRCYGHRDEQDVILTFIHTDPGLAGELDTEQTTTQINIKLATRA